MSTYKGLLIYKIPSNSYNSIDREMNHAYNYFVQKMRERYPDISSQYTDDDDFINFLDNNSNATTPYRTIDLVFWHTWDGIAEVELINRNMEDIGFPDFDTDMDPNTRSIWFNPDDYNDKTNQANPNFYKEQLKDYLPSDFNYEKYVGMYSMLEM